MKLTDNHMMELLRRRTGQMLTALFKLAVALAFVFPFYWMLVTAFKTYNETIIFPPTLWPKDFTVEAFSILFSRMNLLGYAKNSVLVTVGVLALQLVVMVPAAYAFAVYDFPGKKLMFSLVLLAFMVPSQITFITVYLMMAEWGLLKTLLPQIIPFGANAFGIFLLRQSFMQVPQEILEAARLDNAGEARIMGRIMLPMAKPTLVTICMFSFISHWNSYFWPMVMTDTESIRPLTIAIEKMKDVEYGLNWNLIMAGNVILVVPILIIFFFASRKIIESFSYRGVK